MTKTLDQTFRSFDGEGGRDEFNRKIIAQNLQRLLENSKLDLSPVLIDGDWGTGKTEFCMKLCGLLEKSENSRVIYIDAFKADHTDSPLMTILAEVTSLIEMIEKDKSIKRLGPKFKERAIPVARFGLGVAAKAVVHHVLRQDLGKLGDQLNDITSETIDKTIDGSVEALLQDFQQAETNIQSLQGVLVSLADQKPINIFIDELDRCRPDFALDMLETIKHVFDVPGVHFVLITNQKQLNAAICQRYGGTRENATQYLEKFFKFQISMPRLVLEDRNHVSVSLRHFENLIEQSDFLKCPSSSLMPDYPQPVKRFVEVLISANSLTLRAVEIFVRHLEVFEVMRSSSGQTSDMRLVALRLAGIFAIFVHCFDRSLCQNFIAGNGSAERLCRLTGIPFNETSPFRSNKTGKAEVQERLVLILGKQCPDRGGPFNYQTNEAKAYWDEAIDQFLDKGLYSERDVYDAFKEPLKLISLSQK